MPTLEAILERITFFSEEDGYTVARCRPKEKAYQVTVVGKLLGVTVGETLLMEGRWVEHASHGRQFEIERFSTALPASVEGITRYLGSGLIKGIGPATAKKIAETFGPYTLTVIDEQPERLNDVPGLGRKKAELIRQAWREQQHIKEVMAFLQEVNLSPALAVRIFKQYGGDSLAIVRATPYRLADEVYGIGFLTADSIARGLGLPEDSPQRLAAGLRYALSEAGDDGHCYLPWGDLVNEATRLLSVEPATVAAVLEAIAITGEVRVERWDDGRQVFLLPFAFAEIGVAGRVRELLAAPSEIATFFRAANWPRVFAHLAEKRGIGLTERQRDAVQLALTHKVSVLTGGPGTGKTTTLRTILMALTQRGYRVALASPTGRAAKRLAEATGGAAMTLHRLLEYSPVGGPHFTRDGDRPLEADVVVVDEVSMLDLLLANSLLKAVPPHAHLLLVGDADQLPSVGPGRVLRDLLESGAVPSVHLDAIFRQAEGSGIIAGAHRINHGEMPEFASAEDCFFFPQPEPEACAALVVQLVTERIPRRFGLHPLRDIQVLTPTHRGPCGTQNLNALLQEALNPAGGRRREQRFGSTVFREGDRVLQTRNNYDLDVYNGDIGEVTAIDPVEQTALVRYDNSRDVAYDFSQLDELTLAYAISVHKAQGAEYPCVVLPLLLQHYALLQRNLLYTGITRARQLAVLAGDRRAIAAAVQHGEAGARHTGLARRLRGREGGD